MQVVIIPSWYFNAGSASIAGILFHEHAIELIKLGIDAQIAYPGYSGSSWRSSKSYYAIENEVPTWRGQGWFPPKIHKSIIAWWIQKCGLEIIQHFKVHTSPDVIHAQGYQAGWIAEFIFHQTGIPYIATEHYSGFLNSAIPARNLPFIRTAFNNAKFVTAVSPGLKEAMTHHTDADISVIPNDYNPDIFFQEPHRKQINHFQWLTIGEPIYTKGLDLVLEAFSAVAEALPNQKFRLVLADQIPYRQALERMAKQLGISDMIDFAGLLTPKEVAALINQSHVLISASRFETFGKTMLEANACGVPVVATRTAGSTYILASEKQGILCEQGSAKALSKAMIQMYRQYDTFGAAEITAAVASRFRRSDLLSQWINLYNACVHDR
ncbi:MAG TPA: glycosyltransferase [Saprospiraceae bacterium]|jgi:glycosyltransferase involved in cell wall biosynthesis|nr:glycosyltransferase [Saprospiraceae bacterium]